MGGVLRFLGDPSFGQRTRCKQSTSCNMKASVHGNDEKKQKKSFVNFLICTTSLALNEARAKMQKIEGESELSLKEQRRYFMSTARSSKMVAPRFQLFSMQEIA